MKLNLPTVDNQQTELSTTHSAPCAGERKVPPRSKVSPPTAPTRDNRAGHFFSFRVGLGSLPGALLGAVYFRALETFRFSVAYLCPLSWSGVWLREGALVRSGLDRSCRGIWLTSRSNLAAWESASLCYGPARVDDLFEDERTSSRWRFRLSSGGGCASCVYRFERVRGSTMGLPILTRPLYSWLFTWD